MGFQHGSVEVPGNPPSAPGGRTTSPARSRALRIALGYAAFAFFWIYFSDRALLALVSDPETLTALSVYKGFAFVAITALLLLLLIGRAFGSLEASHAELLSHEVENERLRRLYSALSHVNQAIVVAQSREELFARICRALVERGGFKMAWLGWQDALTHKLEPVAHFGDDEGYLRKIAVYTDECEGGMGPSGRAFRSGQAQVTNDFQDDPVTRPWHDLARIRGIKASAAFPVRLRGDVVGVLQVYAAEAGYFQDAEVALITQAATDASFALDNFARREEHRLAEVVAHNEMQFSDAMIEAMPGILYFYDLEGRFIRWNRNFETVSGYSGAEIATMHPREFFNPAEQERIDARIAEVFEKGESTLEAGFRARDGTSTPYFFTGRRVSFRDRTCLVGVGIDISERHRAETALRQSEQRFRSTLDNMMEGAQILDFDWRYLYLNAAASRHNRRPNAELLGKTMPEAWPGIEASPVHSLMKKCLDERVPVHDETEFLFPDGSSSWFELRIQPVPEGMFVLSIDVSERKQAERALHELNESLENKVIERTLEMSAALERAEASDQVKSAFLATMSHELRTPLNSIIGFTGIVLKGLAGPLNPEQEKQLGMVRGSARHLLDLINDVLDLSKIEAGQLEVRSTRFDLRESLERMVASVMPLAQAKGLELRTSLAPDLGHMTSDRRRLEQIVLNLLNNAIKFTDQGSVHVQADRVALGKAPGPGALRLRVTDTGIGIRADELATLFQPFRQVETGLARHHEGTGLGLAICRRLATLMGGEVSAASQWGKGSEFTVVLPLERTPTP